MTTSSRSWSLCICMTLLLGCLLLANVGPADADDTPDYVTHPIVIKWRGELGEVLRRPDSFYTTEQATRLVETILLYQRDSGGWPKNYDRTSPLTEARRERLTHDKSRNDATLDNNATHSEVRFLARFYRARSNNSAADLRCINAILRGVEFMLARQYPNGGWPQFNESTVGDALRISNHITFNDDAMIGVMTALDEVARDGTSGQPSLYPFASPKLRERCAAAVARGVACILKCQLEVDGQKTAWCAQYDEQTLTPRKARTYELVSLSGAESVGIVKFLMRLENPSPEVIAAIEAAVAWFDEVQLTGIREIKQPAPGTPKGWNKVVVQDVGAPSMWARFYSVGGNRPIFCSRDGIPRDSLAEISYERRNGYSWLGYYATELLERDYPLWQQKWASEENVLGDK